MTAPREARYWYFAAKDCRLRYGDGRVAAVGVTHEVEGEPTLCSHGLHASKRALDALRLGAGPVPFVVNLGGEVKHGTDKSCAQRRTYLRGGKDMTPVVVEFACCVAEATLLLAEVTDERSWRCIEATRAYMRGEISVEVLRAECSAACAAYAAYAAHAANAAYAAANAAYAACIQIDPHRAYAAHAEMNELLETMLLEAMP